MIINLQDFSGSSHTVYGRLAVEENIRCPVLFYSLPNHNHIYHCNSSEPFHRKPLNKFQKKLKLDFNIQQIIHHTIITFCLESWIYIESIPIDMPCDPAVWIEINHTFGENFFIQSQALLSVIPLISLSRTDPLSLRYIPHVYHIIGGLNCMPIRLSHILFNPGHAIYYTYSE